MGAALVRGALRAGLVDASAIVVAEPDGARTAALNARSILTVDRGDRAMPGLAPTGVIILAVKPQVFPDVAVHLRATAGERLVVSVMAGVSSRRVQLELGGRCRVIRLMPNLAATVGEGMTALCVGPGAGLADVAWAQRLCRAIGQWVSVEEELMDAFTALAGSGPAYVFSLCEWMARAGESLGIAGDDADRIVRQVLRGASALLGDDSGRSFAEWRDAVASKGGTTEAALAVIQERGVGDAIGAAVRAARDRGVELGRSAR